MNKLKYINQLYRIMENQVNYMTLLKETLKKLHDFILEIIPEDKKNTLVEFYKFNDIAILFYVNHLTKQNIVTELETYCTTFRTSRFTDFLFLDLP